MIVTSTTMKINTILLIVVMAAAITAVHIISIASAVEAACGAGNSHSGDQNLKISSGVEKVKADMQSQVKPDNLVS